ncbi:MAG: hypothetical protein ABIK15_01920 [Pseudomonadota bacterium]
MNPIPTLIEKTRDQRSGQVIFLAHCILNENTRYLGGACRPACVQEIINQCINHNLGMIQLPCPEQQAWGGVLKRWLLPAYGMKNTLLFALRWLLLPLMIVYTKMIYRRMAQHTARQIFDYHRSGFGVRGIIGINGSPSCGVNRTLDFAKSLDAIACLKPETITREKANQVVTECITDGRGLFIEAIQHQLKEMHLVIDYAAHDLEGELNGCTSNMANHSIFDQSRGSISADRKPI